MPEEQVILKSSKIADKCPDGQRILLKKYPLIHPFNQTNNSHVQCFGSFVAFNPTAVPAPQI